ncbi:hypothetical protein QN277_023667 [Acacia crassicarpa]|uniref:F-box domain-containing protein n=1 Tax=Acacia crassicarpa TaxID=499986 RepID=A0AAE1JBZ6_9FABA|nr:hypothetical protein QN277_023667 [Acacia crassicarpa]
MENNKESHVRDWKDMDYEVLMRIFMTLNMVDFVAASWVCSSWRKVCRDRVFWNRRALDLTKWSPQLTQSSPRMIRFLKYALYLSGGKIGSLIFSFRLPVRDGILINIARRSPNLRRLVLPGRHLQITEEGIIEAIQLWGGLESITLTDSDIACTFIEAIGNCCRNFFELKITCNFSLKIAQALVRHLPKLRRLSLQATRVNKDALVRAVTQLPALEDLNVSHCFIVGGNRPENIQVFSLQQVPDILAEVVRMPRLINCQVFCAKCELVMAWNMAIERWNPEEQIWREDEIPTLRI